MIVELTVPGDPVPWARARRKGNRYFTDPKVAEFQERVRAAWMVEGRPNFGAQPAGIRVDAFWGRPRSHYRTGKFAHLLRPDVPRFPRPDCDNVAKGVLDALQGHLFDDDCQIMQLVVYKDFRDPPATIVQAWT